MAKITNDDILQGKVVTESFGDGFTVDSIHAGGTLRPDIIKDLNLASFGLRSASSVRAIQFKK